MSKIRRDVPPTLQTRDTLRPRSPSEALEPQRAPSRPRGSRNRRPESKRVGGFVRVVSGIFTLSLMAMFALGGATYLLYSQFERPGPLAVTTTVAIPKGEGRIEIADRLEREGVIANRWAFVANHLIQTMFGSKKGLELKAGEYEFKKNASMHEVLDIIAEGKSVLTKVTIPEGLTSQQIVERLKTEPSLIGDITEVPAEGTLLPDTYRFSKGMERKELLERMKSEYQRFVESVWEKRLQGLPIQTKEQAVILASIVEKETGRADERDKVAAVFVNRLKKAMRLQSDPTIIYGIAGAQGTLGRPITQADLDQKTPYNTYRIDGLPPGPICNPGRSAIEATLNPAKTNDLYFVADGNGGHTFSDTLKEHNAAVATWRKVEKEIKAKQDAEPKAEPKAADAVKADTQPGSTRAVVRAAPAPAESASDAIPNPPAVDAPTAAATPVAAPAAAPVAAPVAAEASTIPLPVRKPKKQ